ncbi:MAG: serine hydrolase domain-containing protein, partial [Bradyrhizobium sp.]
MPTSTNASGLSKSGLRRMHDVMAGHVDNGSMPGLVALVSRHGEIHADAIGRIAFGGAPMQRDTIFRISSMTKPVTAVAAMILVEQCKLRLDDPVDPWLPELADRKVLRAIDADIDDTVAANRAITLRDLLTFRLGLGMIPVFPERDPILKAIAEAGFAPGPLFPSFPPDELMRRYGTLPLVYQPGERWLYNSGSEILGVLIARVAGMSFAKFLGERIFAPLGMKDTAFSVPESGLKRLVTAYSRDHQTGELKVFDDPVTGKFTKPPVFENGSAGLVST